MERHAEALARRGGAARIVPVLGYLGLWALSFLIAASALAGRAASLQP